MQAFVGCALGKAITVPKTKKAHRSGLEGIRAVHAPKGQTQAAVFSTCFWRV